MRRQKSVHFDPGTTKAYDGLLPATQAYLDAVLAFTDTKGAADAPRAHARHVTSSPDALAWFLAARQPRPVTEDVYFTLLAFVLNRVLLLAAELTASDDVLIVTEGGGNGDSVTPDDEPGIAKLAAALQKLVAAPAPQWVWAVSSNDSSNSGAPVSPSGPTSTIETREAGNGPNNESRRHAYPHTETSRDEAIAVL